MAHNRRKRISRPGTNARRRSPMRHLPARLIVAVRGCLLSRESCLCHSEHPAASQPGPEIGSHMPFRQIRSTNREYDQLSSGNSVGYGRTLTSRTDSRLVAIRFFVNHFFLPLCYRKGYPCLDSATSSFGKPPVRIG